MPYFFVDPRGQMTTAPPNRQRQPGGGFPIFQQSGQFSQGGGQFNIDVPDLQKLIKKYQQGQPDYSPEKMTEGMIGRFRAETLPTLQQATLGAQTASARTGRDYADTLGRTLGAATGGMAAAAGDVVAAGTELGTKASLQQQQMAQEMARVDATMQMEAQQFVAQIEAEFQMLDRQLRAQERIAASQASTAREVAQIQQAGQMARARFLADAQQKANIFAEQQANWRHAQQLKYLSQAEAGRQSLQRDYQSYLIGTLKQKEPPGTQPAVAPQLAPGAGIGSWSYNGRTGTFGMGEGPYQEYQPYTYKGMSLTPYLDMARGTSPYRVDPRSGYGARRNY